MATRLAVCCAFLVLIDIGLVWGQTDLTRTPGSKGADVVDAVIDLIHHTCIFEDDKFFLRRLAFVESRDGNNGNTYRNGYDGGIWQVDNDKFLLTQTSAHTKSYFTHIRQSNLHIDWSQVSWTDLRIPLYSGLAARLYTEVMSKGQDIPREISKQAEFWHRAYHSNPTPISNFTSAVKYLTLSCSKDKPLDAVFILDSSGSVNVRDFEKEKDFVINWITAFDIGPTATQLAVISYSTAVDVQFDLNTYHTSRELITHVKAIRYIGRGTNTAEAIDVAVNRSLSAKYGARKSAAHAAILVTDGRSNDPTATVNAAERARKMKITMFAVGVGNNIDQSELNDVATDPDCTHVFLVEGFSNMESMKQQMEKATCQTKIQMPESNANDSEVVCPLEKPCDIVVPGRNHTDNDTKEAVVTTVNCGNATVYAAYNNPNPGVAYYEIKSVATQDKPSVIYLDGDGRTLYITIEGHLYRLDVNSSIVCKAVSKVVEIPVDPKVDVICTDHGVQRKCTPADLTDFKDELCKVSWEFPNPCTRENLLNGQMKFPHPDHPDRFLMCDFVGKVYIVLCPNDHVYNNVTEMCEIGPGTPGSLNFTRVPLDPNLANPCTVEAILAGQMVFADVSDKTKFITCDVWGDAWISDCPDGLIWGPKDMQCVVDNSIGQVQGQGFLEANVPNPCTKEKITAGQFFFPYPYAQDRYIQCDAWGGAYVLLCFPGGRWSDTAKMCLIGNKT
ncbi:uncharacterized protein LOC135480311 [Liolophura sinensis]|uniref:uncharacterized protein LOC135480311 n=1 Tax=Liolophura sinensis TaxID=3198878 RepID=UPI00315972E3